MYSKKYIRKFAGSLSFDVDTVKPIVGENPTMYRDMSWLIKDTWYSNIGVDLLNSEDPFSDGTLIRKFKFNGTTADSVNQVVASPGSSYYHFQKDGPFGTKCISLDLPSNNAGNNNTFIDCNTLDLDGIGFTLSAVVKFKVATNMLQVFSNINDQMLFKLTNTTDANNYISFQVPNKKAKSLLKVSDGVQETGNTLTADSMYTELDIVDNEWRHIAIAIGRNKISLYINGVLVNSMVGKHINLPATSKLILGDKSLLGYFNIKLLEIYTRELNKQEIIYLLNQQVYSPVVCDGKEDRPNGFNYLQENGNVLAVYSDKDGKVAKIGLEKLNDYVTDTSSKVLSLNSAGVVNIANVLTDDTYFNSINNYLNLDITNSNYIFNINISGYYRNNSLNPILLSPKFKIEIDKVNSFVFTKKLSECKLRYNNSGLDIGLEVPFNLEHKLEIKDLVDIVNVNGNLNGKNNIVFAVSKGLADDIGNYNLFVESVKLIITEIPKNKTFF